MPPLASARLKPGSCGQTERIGDNIAVETVKSDEYTILHPDSTVIVQVKTSRTAVEDELDEEEEGEEGAEEGAEGGAEAPAAEAPAEASEE